MAHTYDDEQIAMNGVYPPTPEKETPTPKTVEDVVGEWDELIKVATKFELRTWLRTTLLAQNQAADERLREVRLEERSLIRYAIAGVAKKHGGIVEEVLSHIIDGLDMISEEEAAKHGITNL